MKPWKLRTPFMLRWLWFGSGRGLHKNLERIEIGRHQGQVSIERHFFLIEKIFVFGKTQESFRRVIRRFEFLPSIAVKSEYGVWILIGNVNIRYYNSQKFFFSSVAYKLATQGV